MSGNVPYKQPMPALTSYPYSTSMSRRPSLRIPAALVSDVPEISRGIYCSSAVSPAVGLHAVIDDDEASADLPAGQAVVIE